MYKFKRKQKYLIPKSKTVTQEFDKPSQLQFFSWMGGTRPVAYAMPEVLEQFLKDFENIVDEFIRVGNPDEYNKGSFMDEQIETIIRLARKDLQRQRIEHTNVIYSIRSIEQSSLCELAYEKMQIEKSIEEDQCDKMKEDVKYEKNLQIYAGNVA